LQALSAASKLEKRERDQYTNANATSSQYTRFLETSSFWACYLVFDIHSTTLLCTVLQECPLRKLTMSTNILGT